MRGREGSGWDGCGSCIDRNKDVDPKDNTCNEFLLIAVVVQSYTVLNFTRIVAAATIKSGLSLVRLLFEGGSYSRAATINYKQVAYN